MVGFKDLMSKVGENEKLAHALSSKGCMPDDAAACLVMTCDPFFDGQMPHLNGLPDAKQGKSMTSVITQELQISAPSVTGTNNWAMHIQTNPWTADPFTAGLTVAQGADLFGNYAQFPAVPRNPLDRYPSVAVWRGLDGNPLGPFRADDPGNAQAIGVGMPDTYSKGVGRLIGMGVEYYDTTPPLYQGGSLRCYEQPTNAFEAKSHISYASPNVGVVTLNGGTSAILMRRPPETPQEANLLAGTVGWKASQGAYLVCNAIEAEIPAKTVDDTQPVIFKADFQAGPRSLVTPADVITGGSVPAPAGLLARTSVPGSIWNLVPYNTKGIMLTGLNQFHTGLLRVRYIYERFPSPDEADFSLAAQPCAEYCSEYFEIKSRMMREQPIAVPVDENFLGEWLYNAISQVFPVMKRAIHAITAPEVEKSSRETQEIAKLAKAVERNTAKKAVVISGSGTTASNPGVRNQAPRRKRTKKKKNAGGIGPNPFPLPKKR